MPANYFFPVIRSTNLLFTMLLLSGLFSIHVAAAGDEPTKQLGKPVNIVELFTSHGCYSCPPADKLLAELIAQDDSLVALEFHVDYWNQLVYGSAGNWVDPFSSKEYTNRQRSYNAKPLSGRPGVYTPQMIVNGEYAAVGSDRKRINSYLNKSSPPDAVSIHVEQSDAQMTVSVKNQEKVRTRLWLVIYDLHERTDITAGENKDVTLDNHHIVKTMSQIGQTISGEAGTTQQIVFDIDLKEGEGCSIVAQDEFPGPVLGAVNCPRG